MALLLLALLARSSALLLAIRSLLAQLRVRNLLAFFSRSHHSPPLMGFFLILDNARLAFMHFGVLSASRRSAYRKSSCKKDKTSEGPLETNEAVHLERRHLIGAEPLICIAGYRITPVLGFWT
jgi:hypothetical protein